MTVEAAVCPVHYTRPGEPGNDWEDSGATQELLARPVNDALAEHDGLVSTAGS